MRTSNCKVDPTTIRGHRYGSSPHQTRFLKRLARRAQRRDNHKEIEAQLVEVEPYFIGKKMYWPTLANIFAPIPRWLMDDWEREGMEYFRRMKSIFAMNRGRGILAWRRQEMARRRYIDTDETLFETLQRSVNRI